VDEAALQLGEVFASELELRIPVTNPTSRAIPIHDITGSCDCKSIAPRSFSIAPQATDYLTVRLNLTAKAGPQALALHVRWGEAPQVQTWTIRGRVNPFFRDGPSWSRVEMRYPERVAVLLLEPAEPLTSLTVAADSAVVAGEVDLADRQAVVTLRLADDAPFGSLPVRLQFSAATASGRVCAVRMPITVDHPPPYVLRPKIINLGRVAEGASAAASVTLFTDFDLTGFTPRVPPAGIVVDHESWPPSDPARRDHTFRIRLLEARPGLQSLTAEAVAMIDGREVTVELPISYLGE
jgi:hypothetical protein